MIRRMAVLSCSRQPWTLPGGPCVVWTIRTFRPDFGISPAVPGSCRPRSSKRLLTELDASEWLRAEAMAEMEPESGDGNHEESASVLFLERPEEWVVRFEGLVKGHRQTHERSELKKLETELRKAVARSGRLEQKLALAERREHEAAGGVEERLAAAAAAQRRSQAKLKSLREQLATQISSTEQEIDRLTAENAELRQQLGKVRSGRARSTAGAKTPKIEAAWSLAKPATLARHLDDLIQAMAVAPVELDKPAPPVQPIRLMGPPAGISPDRAEAIVWLLGIPGTVRVAIDGWNAAHLLESPPVAATRNRIIEAARRIILASSGKRRVTAVFDSSQLGESFSADDVVVTFVGSADDELIEMAERDATGLVVITSDRRVRDAAEKAGAVGLWSEALIDWLNSGGRTFRT